MAKLTEIRWHGRGGQGAKTASLLLGGTVGLLFVVYFWNLDQKLMGWAYVMVNRIFDRKKVDNRL